MDFAPHSNVFCLGNDEGRVNIPRRLLIVHHDIGDRPGLIQVLDFVLVVCRLREVVRRLNIREGAVHFI